MERIRLGLIKEILQSVLELGDGKVEGKLLLDFVTDLHEIIALITLMGDIRRDEDNWIDVDKNTRNALRLIQEQVQIRQTLQNEMNRPDEESMMNQLLEVCINESSLKQSILEIVISFLSGLKSRGNGPAVCEEISSNDRSDEITNEVNRICSKFIQDGHSIGLFIGIIQGDRVYSLGYGVIDKITGQRPDISTLFQIGSITKVLTSLIAESLVDQGVIHWQDSISNYYPNSTITLEQLASHTSGLPCLPESWFPLLGENPSNPYSSLKLGDLEQFIRTHESRGHPSYLYSNLGAGLLGHILEWKTGQSFETLLQQYICSPLRMNHTSTIRKQDSLYATGYSEQGVCTADWQFPILYGAGAVYSNGSDMLRFLSANIEATNGSFDRAKKKVVLIPGGAVGHGWHIDQVNGSSIGLGDIIWHNGGTGGFSSYIGFTASSRCGVVALANQSSNNLDALAIDLLKLVGRRMNKLLY